MVESSSPSESPDWATFRSLLIFGDSHHRGGDHTSFREWCWAMGCLCEEYTHYMAPVYHAVANWPEELEGPCVKYLPLPLALRDERDPRRLYIVGLEEFLEIAGWSAERRESIHRNIDDAPEHFIVTMVNPALVHDLEALFQLVRVMKGVEAEQRARRRLQNPAKLAYLREEAAEGESYLAVHVPGPGGRSHRSRS